MLPVMFFISNGETGGGSSGRTGFLITTLVGFTDWTENALELLLMLMLPSANWMVPELDVDISFQLGPFFYSLQLAWRASMGRSSALSRFFAYKNNWNFSFNIHFVIKSLKQDFMPNFSQLN